MIREKERGTQRERDIYIYTEAERREGELFPDILNYSP
jgi:hypothetical protein